MRRHFKALTDESAFSSSLSEHARSLVHHATALVSIAEKDVASEDLVLQRFVKTSKRLEVGLKALLLVSDMEQPDILDPPPGSPILRLLYLLTTRTNIHYQAFPSFLEAQFGGAAGVRYIIHCNKNRFWSSEEKLAIVAFAMRIIRGRDHDSRQWVQGLLLLEQLMRGNIVGTSETLASLSRTSPAHEISQAFVKITDALNTSTSQPWMTTTEYATAWLPLQLMRSSSAGVAPVHKAPIKYAINPHRNIPLLLARIINLVPTSDGWELLSAPQCSFVRCLALAAFVPVLEFREAQEEVLSGKEVFKTLFATCFDVMLGRTEWQYQVRSETVRPPLATIWPALTRMLIGPPVHS